MALAKIPSRTNYVDEVYKTLLGAISAGSLAPGERILQEELAEQMNVSRSPILQALQMLKKDGLLEEAPGRGLVVTKLDATHIGQVYQIRGALDALAARLAASRKAKIPLSLIEKGRATANGSDVNALIDADIDFHKAIYEASGNPYIAQAAVMHWIHLRRVMGAVLQRKNSRAGIWDEHAAIAKAIHDGDADRAAALSEQHAEAARESLIANLQSSKFLEDQMEA
ncbi:GntR family transcriptional regulator [Polynucleobacter sp. 31A-FELB]|uniref:GntR family transcriptional regulator n=1 Tax=Polynucleobacter sp. 31A-FELB TaxID=2689096 RepID=UPI001C0A98BB|nr:GntR family transcriptional regulator [Polynucleobacter sp. 31A-FELB]MBU3587858.1 GntR family transcriptional regulator [Polynucleobacter sp. 31A-FELB]